MGLKEGRARTLAFAVEKLGGLDVLINNAGGVRVGCLEDTTEMEIRSMIEVEPVAPIKLTRAASPELRAGKDSVVVNIRSGMRWSRHHSINICWREGWLGKVR